MQGVRVAARHKRKALLMWLEDKELVNRVCRKYRVNERTLYRWREKYDGTLESLNNKSSRPHTPHPNSHTKEETDNIVDVFNAHPYISYNEAFGIMRTKFAYSRTFGGFYNFVKRNNIRPRKQLDRYVPQPYDTPDMLGGKWQMDVKFVPLQCYTGEVIDVGDNKYYQYTMIDETTRERFLYPYKERSVNSTLDFVKRAITYYGYLPEIIQTDNGLEFTNHKETHHKGNRIITITREHPLDTLLNSLKIKHQLIPPYTPRLNGKVERSHRSDQESFYNFLKYKTIDQLKAKMLKWNIRYNNRPHASLRDRNGKQVWWTPLQKRADLLKLLQEKKDEYSVRFIKNPKPIQELYTH